jgi:hypothetical protein
MSGRWNFRVASSPLRWKKICVSTRRFPRHIPIIGEVLDRFQPDLIHITGPSEVGMLGAGLAYHRDLPLAASWHTNVHEYLARRSDWLLRLLPERHSQSTGKKIQDLTLAAAARFYSIAKVLFAPNVELCELLESATGPPLLSHAARRRHRAFTSRKQSVRLRQPGRPLFWGL